MDMFPASALWHYARSLIAGCARPMEDPSRDPTLGEPPMSILRNLRVSTKLLVAFGALCLLLVAVVAMAVSNLTASQDRFKGLYNHDYQAAKSLGDVESLFIQMRLDTTSFAVTANNAEIAAASDTVKSTDAAMDDAWKRYQSDHPTASAADQNTVWNLVTQYRTLRVQAIHLAEQHRIAEFVAYRKSFILPVAKKVEAGVNDLQAQETKAAIDAEKTGTAAFHSAMTWMLAMALAAFGAAIALQIAISRSIARPLRKVVDVVNGLAKGRLDQRVDYEAADEVGELAKATNAS